MFTDNDRRDDKQKITNSKDENFLNLIKTFNQNLLREKSIKYSFDFILEEPLAKENVAVKKDELIGKKRIKLLKKEYLTKENEKKNINLKQKLKLMLLSSNMISKD